MDLWRSSHHVWRVHEGEEIDLSALPITAQKPSQPVSCTVPMRLFSTQSAPSKQQDIHTQTSNRGGEAISLVPARSHSQLCIYAFGTRLIWLRDVPDFLPRSPRHSDKKLYPCSSGQLSEVEARRDEAASARARASPAPDIWETRTGGAMTRC